jgi:uncharacterized protein (DUF488 family)
MPPSGTLFTIGVYGFEVDEFLQALDRAEVGLVVDVRQRRGVRGSRYSWANSVRLQRSLADAGLGYVHMKELAPTTAMREAQYREDARRGEGKRSRSRISAEYARLYTAGVLDRADLTPLAELTDRRPALLCVERDPEACHRSLIAARLEREWRTPVVHLKPEGG